MVAVRHVVILWDVDRHYALTDLQLVIPGLEESPAKIPHPATLSLSPESQVNNAAMDLTEIDQPDELEISAEETGTEGS